MATAVPINVDLEILIVRFPRYLEHRPRGDFETQLAMGTT